MLTVHVRRPGGQLGLDIAPDPRPALAMPGAVWIDLLRPTLEEEAAVEAALGVEVPTPEERKALEDSERFFADGDTLYVTATLIALRPDGSPEADAVAFTLTHGRLVTSRAIEPKAFRPGAGRALANLDAACTGADVLMALMDGIVERLADILEETSRISEALSAELYAERATPKDLRIGLRGLGRLTQRIGKIQESLTSLARAGSYLMVVSDRFGLNGERVKAAGRDLRELERFAASLLETTGFLLQSALGLISAEQNQAIKVLSVVATLFLPPTLIASIYGMNFKAMPELGWALGYPLALALMGVSVGVTWAIGRRRGWF